MTKKGSLDFLLLIYYIESRRRLPEYWFMRAVHRLPGRIYPYYLLANLYADPFFYRCDKLERMVQTVLEKEPKIQSTAIKQMRRKARELLKKVPEN